MANSIVSCDGEGREWLLTDEEDSPTEPTCPGSLCGLTAKELGIRVTMRTKNGVKTPNPAQVPGHEIEVEGQDLRFVLSDGDFKVHTPTCPTLKRDLSKSDYEKPAILVAVDQRDAVLQLWDDQIAEADMVDNDSPTEEELGPYYDSTDFHRCVSRLDGFGNAKAEKNGVTKKASKNMLATRLIEAMAAEIKNIVDLNPETEQEQKEFELIRSGMTSTEIRQTAANWVHHFPADRNRWVASGMAIPVRSDWVGFTAEETGGEDAQSEDDLELEEA